MPNRHMAPGCSLVMSAVVRKSKQNSMIISSSATRRETGLELTWTHYLQVGQMENKLEVNLGVIGLGRIGRNYKIDI